MADESDLPPKKKLAATSSTEPQEGVEVSRIPPRRRVSTGKPKRLPRVASMRMASLGMGAANTVDASGGNFYSPELSTDFLELPQSRYEQWNYYRFHYRTNPFVRQAIDLHTELPLSRIRLNIPKAQNRELALAATRFCEKWARKVGLLLRLISIVREFHLIGEVFISCEDNNPDLPLDLVYEEVEVGFVGEDGEPTLKSEIREREDQSEAVAWMKANYKGWTNIRCLPPEQVHMESYNFTDQKLLELIPDEKTRKIISLAESGDTRAAKIVESMPKEIVDAVKGGSNIPLSTDPDAGSFVYYLANKKSDYEEHGQSILESCLRSLTFFDKIRQANTSIASRHMTPIRVVWAADMDAADTEALREQVDMALMDPDFSIIANFQINWEEMGSQQRLLDVAPFMDLHLKEMYAGLGVTEGLLTGESSYSGDKLSLEVINTRYMLLRELIQDFVEQYLFRPMCQRMGFIERDEDGQEVVVYPKLSFTRLALRDNQDTFDALFNLYQKGSVDVDVILELLNIDPVATKEKLERDLFTVNDPIFNEVIRGIYSSASQEILEGTDVVQKIAEGLKLSYKKKPPPGRFDPQG